MKHILGLVSSVFICMVVHSLPAQAFSPKTLPISQSSDHWKVTIEEPVLDGMQPPKGVADLYKVNVTNIGENVYDATIEVYQDDPVTQTKSRLGTYDIPKTQNFFEHQNLGVSVKSKMIEIVVTWREEPSRMMENEQKDSAQKFKQSFSFRQD
ncbi:hypothetical protein [Bacillus sp. OTU530]|uniref:hypothetical protein n=1 Tax=Bacillus sp. OTU530 TaxID=3043862 RepID=UPI00313A7A7B